MKHIDFLQVVLVVNLVALGLVIVTAIVLALNNAGSKNIPLAVAALVGVAVGYGIQLPFELSRSAEHETIGADFVIDRAQPVLRQWVYPDDVATGWRIVAEVGASNWLIRKDPKAYDEMSKRDKAAKDMMVFSLLSYLTTPDAEWGLERKSYGNLQTWQNTSKPEECTAYDEAQLRELLRKAGNDFAGAPLQLPTGKRLCLPPRTAIYLSEKTLTLENAFCKIAFTVEHPAHAILNVDPKTRMYVPLNANEPRYEIRTLGLYVETTFFALRSQHRDSKRYHDWGARVVNGARAWFAPGDPRQEPQNFVEHPAGNESKS